LGGLDEEAWVERLERISNTILSDASFLQQVAKAGGSCMRPIYLANA